MLFTIFGSTGFIGKNLVNYLKDQGIDVQTPNIRNDDITNIDLGNIIYAIGEPTQKGNVEIFYQMSDCFVPESALGIHWNDPSIGIKWPFNPSFISERDNSYSFITPELKNLHYL